MPQTLRLLPDRTGDLERAAEILRGGGLVAFPTETVYGLGANALSPAAVAGIFAAKQRPSWDPLIVHLADSAQMRQIAAVPEGLGPRVRRLAEAFWPGPLTLLLPRTPVVPDAVTAGRPLVGVRVPAHPVAQLLLRAAGMPVAAPSANRFGHISPTTAQHVLDDLDGRIGAVLDGGPTTVGLESTVLDPAPTPMVLYRAGALTAEMLQAATGVAVASYVAAIEGAGGKPEVLPSPGVGMRHYAPETPLVLSGPKVEELEEQIAALRQRVQGGVGVLLPTDWTLTAYEEVVVEPWGPWNSVSALSQRLFAGLRALEKQQVATIVCPLPEPGGAREALRDRLLKAARPR